MFKGKSIPYKKCNKKVGLKFAFYQIYGKYYRKIATLSSHNETMIIKKHKSFGVESFGNESFTFK